MAETPEDVVAPEGVAAQEIASDVALPAETESAADEPLTIDDLARDLGWKPEEEWRGPKDNWTPAADFLRSKVSKSERLSSEIRDVKDTVTRISRTTAAITERAVSEERERLSQRFIEATEAGNTQAAWQAAQDLQKVDATTPDDGRSQFEAWRAKNPWFDSDPEANAYVVGLGEVHKGKSFEEQTRAIEAAVRKRFPEHFEGDAPRQQHRAPLVSAPPSRAARPSPRQKSEADLPAEARRAGEDFVRRGRVGSLADYAKIYFEENA